MLYELIAAFAVGFMTGRIYETERMARLVSTAEGLKQFLLTHAPWHLKRMKQEHQIIPRQKQGPAISLKTIILAGIIILMLTLMGVV